MNFFRKKKKGDEVPPQKEQTINNPVILGAPVTVKHESSQQQRKLQLKQGPLVESNEVGMVAPLSTGTRRKDTKPRADGGVMKPALQQAQVEDQEDTNVVGQTRSSIPLISVKDLEEGARRNDVTRELVKKFVADIWNRGDLELIPQVCSKSLRFNGSVGMDRVGHDGFARMVTTIRDALNDYHCEIHSMVVEGNKAFCRMRFTGRHTGSLLGYPPTGRQVAWMGAAEFTCKDDLIIKVWELGDVKSLEEQLSATS
jgi:steroid delta-isomerase-like uncharacterized protein